MSPIMNWIRGIENKLVQLCQVIYLQMDVPQSSPYQRSVLLFIVAIHNPFTPMNDAFFVVNLECYIK